MSELYYANFKEFKNKGMIMKNVVDGIDNFIWYHNKLKYHINQQFIEFKFREINDIEFRNYIKQKHKRDIDKDLLEKDLIEKSEIFKELSEYFPVEIIENEDMDYKDFDTIFEQKMLFPKLAERGRWKEGIKVIEKDNRYGVIILGENPLTDTLFVSTNDYQLRQIINALQNLRDKPSEHHLPLIRLFQQDRYEIDWPKFDNIVPPYYHFLHDLTRSGCAEQRKFVAKSLGTTDFTILDGPPGTGKTQVICEIIYQKLLKGERIMLVASTHVAVDNVIERLIADAEIENIIFPVRIASDVFNVSDKVKHFLLQNLSKSYNKRIRIFLKKTKNRTAAQNILYDALINNEKVDIINDAIINASNLVCGTTIGILQFPPIKAMQKETPKPLFDMMILDEASKTPFYEFIVPALWARRWVLSGDPEQLSPYVDSWSVEHSIEMMVERNFMKLSDLSHRELFLEKYYDNPKLVIVGDESFEETLEIYSKISDELDREFTNIEELYQTDKFNIDKIINTSKILIVKASTFAKRGGMFPPEADILFVPVERDKLFHLMDINRDYFGRYNLSKSGFIRNNWLNSVSYRLHNKFSVRKTPHLADKYQKDLDILCPVDNTQFHESLDSILNIFFPSILEVLQEGYKGRYSTRNCTLLDGFDDETLSNRHELLIYQHRMHPDISKIPSKIVYDNKSLLDAERMVYRRGNWRPINSRIRWFDVRRKKRGKESTDNIEEVREVMRELDIFIKWVRFNLREKKRTVAILAFYKKQVKLFRKELRKKFNSAAFSHFSNEYVEIDLQTVDKFQGHEADIVFLSLVNNSRLGFLNVRNRINVAITRAKFELLIFGNNKYFKERGTPILKELSSIPKNVRF